MGIPLSKVFVLCNFQLLPHPNIFFLDERIKFLVSRPQISGSKLCYKCPLTECSYEPTATLAESFDISPSLFPHLEVRLFDFETGGFATFLVVRP